jgi:hypothetical protein
MHLHSNDWCGIVCLPCGEALLPLIQTPSSSQGWRRFSLLAGRPGVCGLHCCFCELGFAGAAPLAGVVWRNCFWAPSGLCGRFPAGCCRVVVWRPDEISSAIQEFDSGADFHARGSRPERGLLSQQHGDDANFVERHVGLVSGVDAALILRLPARAALEMRPWAP